MIKPTKAQSSQNSPLNGTSFLVTIYHQENHSWQGSIQWLETGIMLHFRSELELMNLISKAIQSGESKEQELRTWDDYRTTTAPKEKPDRLL